MNVFHTILNFDFSHAVVNYTTLNKLYTALAFEIQQDQDDVFFSGENWQYSCLKYSATVYNLIDAHFFFFCCSIMSSTLESASFYFVKYVARNLSW